MPTWKSFQEYAKALRGFEAEMTGPEAKAITKQMAQYARLIAIQQAKRDLGGDTKFSGWPTKDLSELRVKPGRDNVHWMFPTRRSGGGWKVAEVGRNQGNATGRGGVAIFLGPSIDRKTGETFRTKTGKIRQTRNRRKTRWNGYTQGKETASKAKVTAERLIPKLVSKEVLKLTRKHFDVT